MAGPTCGVVLERELSVLDRAELERGITSISSTVEGANFWVQSTAAIGGGYSGESRPFILEILDEHRIDLRSELEEQLGWEPKSELSLIAMCNGQNDHRILAELALWTAKTLGGWIDLGGAIAVPRQWASHLPGRLHRILYEANAGTAESHLVDPAFLEAWMRWPDFRMVK